MRDRAVLRLAGGEGGPAGRCSGHRGITGDGGGGARAHRARGLAQRHGGAVTAEDARIPVTADAALFCAVHDILQSPGALRNVMNHLRPGARVAAGGGKWAAPWLVAVNLLARMLHAPYVRSFEGFDRPWHHLEQLIEDVQVRELAFGSGYILTGRSSRSRRPGSPGGCRGAAGSRASQVKPGRGAGTVRASLHRPASLEQGGGEQLRRGEACPVTGVHLVHRCARDRPGQLKLGGLAARSGPGW